MSEVKKIAVIGSGFGGIAAALRLKAKGHEVTLIEKQNDLGGRARVFKKDGYTFDAYWWLCRRSWDDQRQRWFLYWYGRMDLHLIRNLCW